METQTVELWILEADNGTAVFAEYPEDRQIRALLENMDGKPRLYAATARIQDAELLAQYED